ncbi:PEP-CTERM sorting domain-containing protein [Scytonema sp. PCC 10023]|uniref:PEP-CTERM sorting domain-containing protein n=1 Tax=Scytonema sp. PCC 10023 TaxID=1680591 RepID=UPI0039C6EB15
MKQHLGLINRILLLATPVMASSILVASPSHAATFGSSEATLNIENFNRNPLGIRTITDTVSNAISTDAQVNANANANAYFEVDPNSALTFASNSSSSKAQGQGASYLGEGQSFAGVLGYDFLVQPGETFSFDFNGLLDLKTSIDNPTAENATANGLLQFALYDSENNSLLDSFTIAGNLATLGNDDALEIKQSSSITLDPGQTSYNTSFGGTQEIAQAAVKGNYSRTFDKSTYLTLVEIKTNQVRVQAPEPSTVLSLLFGCGILGMTRKRKREAAISDS